MGNNFYVTNIHTWKQADTKIHTDTDTQTFIHKWLKYSIKFHIVSFVICTQTVTIFEKIAHRFPSNFEILTNVTSGYLGPTLPIWPWDQCSCEG